MERAVSESTPEMRAEAERIITEWERLEDESMREGHAETLTRLIAESLAHVQSGLQERVTDLEEVAADLVRAEAPQLARIAELEARVAALVEERDRLLVAGRRVLDRCEFQDGWKAMWALAEAVRLADARAALVEERDRRVRARMDDAAQYAQLRELKEALEARAETSCGCVFDWEAMELAPETQPRVICAYHRELEARAQAPAQAGEEER
jgi:hypothetical protein